ncbi:amidohydrolase family protein [Amnibacterium setariae]|uniref:Amidohydrolase n=1 Tax=Amnibacterium setariae TaxID=2306585 RepID=A0A3A1TYG5_9MICO|nr:amidohydrolase [Amnibacterium setariae]RIX27715.1 amidohydrolase [Amnibacterium setariae]
MTVLLTADLAVPDAAARTVLEGAGVLVEGDVIVEVGDAAALRAAHPEAREEALGEAVLLPGLVNAHHHSGVLRGTAEHLPVWQWLEVHIDPMHRVLRPEEAETAARLCYAEGLLAGTTTVVDMWRYMDGAARAARELGNRLVSVSYVGAHPDHDYFDSLDDNERMLREWSGDDRVTPWVGLEHPFYADDAGLARAIAMAHEHGTGLYTHCSESRDELPDWRARFGAKPLVALERIGFLDAPRVALAHAVWLDDEEIGIAAAHDVGVAHAPVSNMKLASGVAPVVKMLAAGLAVGLGTDGEKENNNLDLFEELKTASLLAKLSALDAAVLDPWEALAMATTGGARMLGMADRIGRLAPGMRADVIAVRTDTPRMTPLIASGPYENVAANLVHAVRGSDVAFSMVGGAPVVRDGRLLTADLQRLIADARAVVPGLFARRAALAGPAASVEG